MGRLCGCRWPQTAPMYTSTAIHGTAWCTTTIWSLSSGSMRSANRSGSNTRPRIGRGVSLFAPLVLRWFAGLLYSVVVHRCIPLEVPTMLILPQATALGPLEHAIMRIVWAHAAPITVKQVHEALR